MTERGARKTIAVFFDYLSPFSGIYQEEVRAALDEQCRARDINLWTVFGRAIQEPNAQSPAYNSIFNLMGPERVDGIIVLSATLASHCGVDGMARFLKPFRGTPLCSLGVAVDGLPSVLVDNRRGIDDVMDHVIAHHGARRVAFVGGPAQNPEAQLRMQAYRDALERHGIGFDPGLVAYGDFQWVPGGNAVEGILSRRPAIDAVVAANDTMALGAIEVLRKRGYRIPDDVRVTGFDNVDMSAISDPPLTTVAQPYSSMAGRALDLVLDQIAGRAVPEITELAAELVVRRSCGCSSVWLYAKPRREHESPPSPPRAAESPSQLEQEEPPLLNALLTLLADGDEHELLRAAHPLRGRSRSELKKMWEESCERVAIANQKEHLRHRVAASAALGWMSTLSERISVALDLPSLKQALQESLSVGGLRTVFLARHVDGRGEELEPYVTLLAGEAPSDLGATFPAGEIIPPGAYGPEQRHTLLVFPVVFDTERLGVVAFEDAGDTHAYQMIRDQIAAALRNIALHQAVLENTMRHERLVQEQARQATAKRLQALSVLAGGVAHDLNNVLGPLVALPDLMFGVCDQMDPGHRAPQDLRDDIECIKGSALRAAQTVKDLLTLSREGRTMKEPLDVAQLVSECLSGEGLRAIQRLNAQVTIAVTAPSEPLVIRASDAHVVRAVTNLVRNAAEAVQGLGTIEVKVSRTRVCEPIAGFETVDPGDYVAVSVSDNGIGIAEPELGRVFEPFFSQKRLGEHTGSGLGLSIVHSVVKEHDGFVDVSSTVGQGTTFTLYFPFSGEALSPKEDVAAMQRGTARILIVDDEPVQLRTCRRVLSHLGYAVEGLTSGRELAALFEHAVHNGGSPYDLLILDMVLDGGLDGLELYEQIQQICPSQKAIIVSGYAATSRAEAALQKGLMWLMKPYTADALVHAVQKTLSGPGSVRATTLGTVPPGAARSSTPSG